MNSFGEARGKFTHQSSVTQVVKPKDDYLNIQNLLKGIEQIYEVLNKLSIQKMIGLLIQEKVIFCLSSLETDIARTGRTATGRSRKLPCKVESMKVAFGHPRDSNWMGSLVDTGTMFNLMPPLRLQSIAANLEERGIDVDSVKIAEGKGERLRDNHVVNVAPYPGLLSVTFNMMQRSSFTSCYGYIYFESTRGGTEGLS